MNTATVRPARACIAPTIAAAAVMVLVGCEGQHQVRSNWNGGVNQDVADMLARDALADGSLRLGAGDRFGNDMHERFAAQARADHRDAIASDGAGEGLAETAGHSSGR